MLSICNNLAVSHGLHFNVRKTQLICFRSPSTRPCSATILFNNTQLHYSDQVTHLGHILTSDLNDKQDIIRVIKDMNREANSILRAFSSADPFVKCYLVKCYCLSLYGCTLWSLSTSSVKVSLNKLLRKVWNLPRNSHTGILHCVAQVHTISNFLYKRFLSLYSHASSSSLLVGLSFLILHN